MARLDAPRSANSWARRATKATSTLQSKWNLFNDRAAISQKQGVPAEPHKARGYSMCEIAFQRSFFGFWIFSVCFTTNDFTRANSFWKPFAKLFGPYSKSTTKQKAKTMKRTSQNSPRSNPMAGRVTRHQWAVNAAYRRVNRIESESETATRTVPVTDVF